jgi:hypothetical protein
VPVHDPQQAFHELRRLGRQQRRDEGFDELKAQCKRIEDAKQEIAGQTEPAGLFRLPGVEPRNAEQAEKGHGEAQVVDGCPLGGGDRRQSVSWMDCLDGDVKNP